MKRKIIVRVLLIAFIIASCTPIAITTSSSQKISIPTFTPFSTEIATPSPTSHYQSTPIITISSDYGTIATGSSLFIKNKGSATAKNITVWICVSQFFNGWQILDNISSLSIIPENWTANFTQDQRHSDICPFSNKTKENAIALRFNSLAPKQTININIKPKESIRIFEQIYNGVVQIKFPTNMAISYEPGERYFSPMISTLAMEKTIESFETKMLVANLTVKTTCDNCSSDKKNFNYYLAAKLFSNSCNQPTKNSLYSKINCQVKFEYYTPIQTPSFPIASDIVYFFVVHQEKQNYSLTEINKTEFDTNFP